MNDLSPKQIGIIHLLAQGMTTIDIAEEINITQSTVETYKAQMFKAYSVRSAAQLVSWAYQNKILKVIE